MPAKANARPHTAEITNVQPYVSLAEKAARFS